MSIAVSQHLPVAASPARRADTLTPVVRWDARRLKLGLKGWVVFYFLWACIFTQTSFDPAQTIAAPAAVSSVSSS